VLVLLDEDDDVVLDDVVDDDAVPLVELDEVFVAVTELAPVGVLAAEDELDLRTLDPLEVPLPPFVTPASSPLSPNGVPVLVPHAAASKVAVPNAQTRRTIAILDPPS
jgi:hypothetical protein